MKDTMTLNSKLSQLLRDYAQADSVLKDAENAKNNIRKALQEMVEFQSAGILKDDKNTVMLKITERAGTISIPDNKKAYAALKKAGMQSRILELVKFDPKELKKVLDEEDFAKVSRAKESTLVWNLV